MQTLAGLSRRYLVERKGRTVLTGVGVALGVAVFFATLVVITSLNRGIARQAADVAGRADILATPPGGIRNPVPNETVDQLERLDGVAAVARGLVDSAWISSVLESGRVVRSRSASSENLLVGMDVAELEQIYSLPLVEGRAFADGRDEIVLPVSLAEELQVSVGEEVLATLPFGRLSLQVVGLLDDRGIARFNGGLVVLTSLATAQRLAERPGEVSFAALVLEQPSTARAWLAAHRDAARPELTLSIAKEFGEWQTAIGGFAASFTVCAALVLFVAAFLIFLTLSMAVAERQATLGILRAVGAGRTALLRLVIGEAMALGAVATLAGLVIGVGLAALTVELAESGPTELPVTGVPVTGRAVGLAAALGIGATVLSAIVPARRAARVAPLTAIREPGQQDRGDRPVWMLGLLALTAGAVLGAVAEQSVTRTATTLLLLLGGTVLLVPTLLPGLATVLAGVSGWRPARMARVVVGHLVRERTRSGYTLALAMAVIAMTTALGAAVTSFARTGDQQLAAQFRADLNLHAGSSFDEEFVGQVAALPGVAAATPVRWGQATIGGRDVDLTAIDPTTYFDVASFAWAEGEEDTQVARRLAAGGQVVIPEYWARQLGVGGSDTISVDASTGRHQLVVAGIYRSVGASSTGDGWSALVIGQRDGVETFGLDRVIDVDVRLDEGADADTMRQTIEEALLAPADDEGRTDKTTFVVTTGAETEARFQGQIRQLAAALGSIAGLAALVSALGLANTLAVSMLERRRELGVLRAMGLDRSQARALAVIEAGLLVTVAAVLALPLGFALSRPLVHLMETAFGNVLLYTYPWRWLAWVVVMALVVTVVAAIAPARRAARLDVAAALRFE